jgi:hypothetical protein
VTRLRLLRTAVLISLLCVSGLLVLAWLTGQIEQHIFRRRAERLLAEVQALDLRQTPWNQVQSQFRSWGSAVQIDGKTPCDEHSCQMEILLEEGVYRFLSGENVFVRLDNYLRWRLKLPDTAGPFVRAEVALLHAYIRAGGRPAQVLATLQVHDGIVWTKGFRIIIVAYSPTLFGGVHEYSLMADAGTLSRFRGSTSNSVDPQVTLHPNYTIGAPGGCEICIAGWVYFTPYADRADIHRLMQFDLSCLTRFHQCLTQADLMPLAWSQYQAELRRVQQLWNNPPPCSPSLLEWLGRDSVKMAAVEIVGPVRMERAWSTGIRDGHVAARILAPLKGLPDWRAGEISVIGVSSASPQQEALLLPGSRLIAFGTWGGNHAQLEFDLWRGCPLVPLTDTNLALVRRGLAQDYSAAN